MGLREALARRDKKTAIVRVAEAVMRWAAQGDGPWRVGDLVPVVEHMTGASITVRETGMDTGAVGFTEWAGDEVEVRISSDCATWEHTLAHELGHVILDHQFCTMDDCTPPPACEDLSRRISRELADEIAELESEAEIFADRVMELLPSAMTSSQVSPVTLLWKASF